MSIKQFSSSTRSFADVSIEFAHVEVGEDFSDNVTCSGVVAAALAKELEQEGKSYSVALLVDDKHAAPRASLESIAELLSAAAKWLVVDYVVFETRLTEYKLDLFDAIQADRRTSVRKTIEKYESKSGRIACSHDIAIWHLLRLGHIRYDLSTVVPIGARPPRAPFIAKHVISILQEIDREPEERADSEILRFCTDVSVSKSITRRFI